MSYPQPVQAPVVALVDYSPLSALAHMGHAHASSQQDDDCVTWMEGLKIDRVEINLIPQTEHGLTLIDDVFYETAYFADGKPIGLLEGVYYEPAYIKKATVYKWGCRLMVGSSNVGLVQCEPVGKKQKAAPAKLTFNMAELKRLGAWPDFLTLLNRLLPENDSDHLPFRVKLIEFAVDVPFQQSGYWWWSKARGGKTQHLLTFYHGKRKAKCVVAAYDKAKQLAEVKGMKIAQASMGRVEVRLNPKTRWQDLPAYLAAMPNPFFKIRPVEKTVLNAEIPQQGYAGFWSVVSSKGLTDGLKLMAPKARQKMYQRLEALPTPAWWTPDEWWTACLSL